MAAAAADLLNGVQPAVISVRNPDDDDLKVRDSDDFVQFEHSDGRSQLLDNLLKLRKSRQFCDVVLQVSSKVDSLEIYCHRAVVASISPYLFEIFDQRLKTGTTDRAMVDHVVVPGEYDVNIFEALIDYAYTAKIVLSKRKLPATYDAAVKLKILPIVNFCGAELVSTVTTENCLGVRAVLLQSPCSGFKGQQSLVSKLDSFIKKNISAVLKDAAVSNLGHIQVELIQGSSVEMESTNERHLLEMVLDWLLSVYPTEDTELQRLTEKVHMLYLNRDRTLHDCVDIESGDARDSELVQDYKRLSKKLNQIQGGGAPLPGNPHNNSRGTLDNKVKANQMCNTPVKPKQFLYTRPDPTQISDSGDYDSENRILASTAIGPHSSMGLVVLRSQIIVLSVVQRLNSQRASNLATGLNCSSPVSNSSSSTGSGSPNGTSLDVEKNDNENVINGGGALVNEARQKVFRQLQQLSNLAPMSNSRGSMGVAELCGSLFVCGGYDRGECLRSVELLSLSENKWSRLPDMVSPRARTNIAIVDGRIYAVGGSDGSRDLASVEVYDAEKNRWELLPPLPVPRSHAGVCALKGKIYVIGGWNGAGQRGMTRVDVFDPSSKQWSTVASLSIGRSQAAVAVMNGSIYVIGGCEAWSCTTSVEKYIPETDRWVQCGALQLARRGCGAACLNGRLYAIGGHDSSHSLCSVEVYDSLTNAWTPGPFLTTCRANVGAVVVQGRLFAVGGFNGKTFLNTLEMLDSLVADDEPEWTTFIDRSRWFSSSNHTYVDGIRKKQENFESNNLDLMSSSSNDMATSALDERHDRGIEDASLICSRNDEEHAINTAMSVADNRCGSRESSSGISGC